MNTLWVGRAARAFALLIALLAVIDPSLTSDRSTHPEVVVLAADASDSTLTRLISEQLSRTYTVLDVPFIGAAATVIAGARVPDEVANVRGAVFAVVPEVPATSITLTDIDAPRHAAVDERVRVTGAVEVRGARGKAVELTLLADGSVVDRATDTVQTDRVRVRMPLSFVPTAAGVVTLSVQARVQGVSEPQRADVVVDVLQQKWAVLFFDARPSWMSTFVRRAVERDTRFAVTSRVVTSTNLSTDAGRPPATLNEASVMELYDAIVVGAPEALSDRDVQGLERFLRRRGGSVVLLFDGNHRGAYERLASIGPFVNVSNAKGTVIAGVATDSVALRATEWMWPAQLPPAADVLASSDAHETDSAKRHPSVWATSAGAGRVIVSGALDSWKFRDEQQSAFERFWRETIAVAADGAAKPVEISASGVPLPGTVLVPIEVTSRSASLNDAGVGNSIRAAVSVRLESANSLRSVRVWPRATPGTFAGTLRAPSEPGTYRIVATSDGASASMPLVIARTVPSQQPPERDVQSAWVSAHGGTVIPANRREELAAALLRLITPSTRRVVWHPMRSAWWIVPFALALSLEWWLRRRRGLP